MIDLMSSIITLFISLSAAIFAFILNILYNYHQNQKELKTARIIFKNEINDNLFSLEEFFNLINTHHLSRKSTNEDMTLDILKFHFPLFNKVVWKNQNIYLITAFNTEESKNIQKHYNNLNLLELKYTHLKNKVQEYNYYPSSSSILTKAEVVYLTDFIKDSSEFMDLINEILMEANPVHDKIKDKK